MELTQLELWKNKQIDAVNSKIEALVAQKTALQADVDKVNVQLAEQRVIKDALKVEFKAAVDKQAVIQAEAVLAEKV